jgi:aminopeptidase YwaD
VTGPLLLALWLQASPAHGDGPPALDGARLLGHVGVLAGPELQGRGITNGGAERAASYVASQLQQAKLTGGAADGGYLDCFEIRGPAAPGSLLEAGEQPLEPGRDFVANVNSPLAAGVAPAVFAGYGLQGRGYDDYQGIDARGKVVVLLRHAPALRDRSLRDELRARMGLAGKLELAARQGARAVLFVSGPGRRGSRLASLRVPAVDAAPPVASFHVSRALADRWLAQAGSSLPALEQSIRRSGRPASRPLAVQVGYQVRGHRGCNVLARLPGADPRLRHQLVVVAAHLDHLGMGDEGNSADARHVVHPGADDNASGVAALLEIARALAASAGPAPRRTLLFAAVTGEEKGLRGSQHLARRLEGRQVVAMLNMDMIGRMRGRSLEVDGAATAAPLRAMVEQANTDGLRLTFLQTVAFNSDHLSFIERRIPALSLSTGLHRDYHRAGDTAARIDRAGLLRTARLALAVGRRLADWPAPLTFVPPPPSGDGVRLGIVPDLETAGQVRVAGVLPGTPAAAAGLQPGDVIRDLGGQALADLGSYGDALARFRVGQRVPMTFERAGARRAVEVLFTAPLPFDPP